MKNRLLIATLLIQATVAAAGCKKQPEVPEPAPTNVVVAVVQPAPMVDRLPMRAIVEPWMTVKLSTEVAGRLEIAPREKGEAVTRGEILFGINTDSLKARVLSAEALEGYARVAYERSKKLFDQDALSQDALDKSIADRKAAEATLAVAKAELEKATTRAPIDGVLDARPAEIGEFMTAGSALGTVVDTSRVKVTIPVPEKDIRFVTLGEPMDLYVDALQRDFRGKVIYIKEVADPATLTFDVQIGLDNADSAIRPGMIARVNLVRRAVADAIAVPIFSLIRLEDGYQVFVEQEGKAVARLVTIGIFDGVRVQITKGLDAGDHLIVQGQKNVVDGETIRVVGSQDLATGDITPVSEAAASGDGAVPAGVSDGAASPVAAQQPSASLHREAVAE